MSANNLLRRLARLEADADGIGEEILFFSYERREPDGSLTLIDDGPFGERVVARIPADKAARLIRVEWQP